MKVVPSIWPFHQMIKEIGMTTTATLGYPRIGPRREYKAALEGYWQGKIDQSTLRGSFRDLRTERWRSQAAAGIQVIPSNDCPFYDHVLDACCMVGVVPPRFAHPGGPVDLDTYFRMARGDEGVPALEMTKWFDTNYHYLVPEVAADSGTR